MENNKLYAHLIMGLVNLITNRELFQKTWDNVNLLTGLSVTFFNGICCSTFCAKVFTRASKCVTGICATLRTCNICCNAVGIIFTYFQTICYRFITLINALPSIKTAATICKQLHCLFCCNSQWIL